MNQKNRISRAGMLVASLLFAPHCLSAQTPADWQFTPLLPQTVTLPNGTSAYLVAPVLAGATKTFTTYQNGEATGIYRLTGTDTTSLTKIADTKSHVPDDYRRFAYFEDSPSVYGDQIAFAGGFTPYGVTGVYLSQNGKLSVVADSTTTLPGSTNKAYSARLPTSSPAFNANHLLFTAYGNGTNGLYSREKDGSLIRIADNSMTVPGTNVKFRSFGQAQLSGDRVAFLNGTSGAGRGAYLYDHGAISTIANDQTLVPGTNTPFQTVYETAMSDSRTVFAARYKNGNRYQYSLYENTPGGIVSLLDPNTLLPDGADYTYLPSQLLASGDTLAFTVNTLSSTGNYGFYGNPIFVNRNGVTEKLLSLGDQIEGKAVSFFAPLQFDAGRLVVQVSFADNSFGYYTAQAVLEPGAFTWLVGCGVSGSLMWRRSRVRRGRERDLSRQKP